MRYLVIDQNTKYDEFVEEFNTKEEAITFADNEWKGMVKADRDKRVAFYILESVDPDPESDDHFDGDFVKIYK